MAITKPKVELKGAGVKCPVCGQHKFTRKLPRPRGYDPKMQLFNCDWCEIGWMEVEGKRSTHLTGDAEAARKLYDPAGRLYNRNSP
jgi:hypothetical protein